MSTTPKTNKNAQLSNYRGFPISIDTKKIKIIKQNGAKSI